MFLASGVSGSASVLSGASKGSKEALELMDNDLRFHGMGVMKAIYNINFLIRNCIIGMEVFDQKSIDFRMIELDGTINKSNSILGVSLAVLHAAANESGVPLYKYVGDGNVLPVTMMNIINGGCMLLIIWIFRSL